MADIAFLDLPTRLAKVLLNRPAKTSGPTKLSPLQKELAEVAGGTRENVNPCLRNWQRRGIVVLKGGWTTILKADDCAVSLSRISDVDCDGGNGCGFFPSHRRAPLALTRLGGGSDWPGKAHREVGSVDELLRQRAV